MEQNSVNSQTGNKPNKKESSWLVSLGTVVLISAVLFFALGGDFDFSSVNLDSIFNPVSKTSGDQQGTNQPMCRCVKSETYDASGTLLYYSTLEYDGSTNQPSKEVSHYPNGTDGLYTQYFYDESGRLVEEYCFYNTGATYATITYMYGNDGQLQEKKSYRADGTLRETVCCSYDETGRITQETSLNAEGGTESVSLFDYKDNQKPALMTSYSMDNSIKAKIEYEYDTNGNKIKETRYSADGATDLLISFEYGS